MGGMIALPPVASQMPVKYLCFLVNKATDKPHVNPQKLGAGLNSTQEFPGRERSDLSLFTSL